MPLINLDSEINVERVRPDTGSFYKFVATDAECQLLAARFDFIEVGSLSAELRVRKAARGCWDVSGQLKGEIVQACGATGVPVSETIDFLLEERYVRTAATLTRLKFILMRQNLLKMAQSRLVKCWHNRLRLQLHRGRVRLKHRKHSQSARNRRTIHLLGSLR